MYVVCLEPRVSSYTAGRSGDSTRLCVHGFVWRSADITSSTREHVTHAREAHDELAQGKKPKANK